MQQDTASASKQLICDAAPPLQSAKYKNERVLVIETDYKFRVI